MAIDDSFYDLDAYVSLPRLAGLRLSPDGQRLVVSVARPDAKNSGYSSSIWEVDPAGERPARRITRSEKGESPAGWTPEGDLLFVSARPRPEGNAKDEEPGPALWCQPRAGGDAYVVSAPAGGVSGVRVSDSGRLLFGSQLLPSAATLQDDEEARKSRKDGGISAILHEGYPVRYWDHDLGPAWTRLLTADKITPAAATAKAKATANATDTDTSSAEIRDLTGHLGGALDDTCSWDLAPDGATVVAEWCVAEPRGSQRHILVAVDVASREVRVLADNPDNDYSAPRVSPDGSKVAVVVRRRTTPEAPGPCWVATVTLKGNGEERALTAGWDRIPVSPRWAPDGEALVVAADDLGRAPLWRVDAASGEVRRLTADNGAYTDHEVSPDGRFVYALRSAVDSPPAVVRIALSGTTPPEITPLPAPEGTTVTIPGRLEEITATAADGTGLRAWLALPTTAAQRPAPLLLWVHGGPQSSWNSWSWRWNPWIAVAHGYAVLLPDPALSTGYGLGFIARGWGEWGGAPYTDLMAITDVAVARQDIDGTRTAAMGGSFGGYMANWIAGHTDRFEAIVTHASLWALEPFAGTTDASYYWSREMTPAMTAANSPHAFVDRITTPMLVIHGDKDYRVPLGEGLRLWWSLLSQTDLPHKFLYFPDENHWILKPGNAKAWYATVLAFLAHHLGGEEWQRPELLK